MDWLCQFLGSLPKLRQILQEEQKLYCLLGEMYLKDSLLNEAIKYYQRAFMVDGKSRLGQQARDKYLEIKNKISQNKNQ